MSAGVALAHGRCVAIDQIKESSIQVVAAVTDISATIEEQSIAAIDMARYVEDIAGKGRESNAAIHEDVQTIETLAELAAALQGSVDRFEL